MRFSSIVVHVSDAQAVVYGKQAHPEKCSCGCGDTIRLMDAVNWKEDVHPRDPDGKFAKSGNAAAKSVKMLKQAGFAKHPESEHGTELYHHPSGHSVGFKASNQVFTPHFAHYLNKKYQGQGSNAAHLQEILDKIDHGTKAEKTEAKEEVKEAAKSGFPEPSSDVPETEAKIIKGWAEKGAIDLVKVVAGSDKQDEPAVAYAKQVLEHLGHKLEEKAPEPKAEESKAKPLSEMAKPHPDSEPQKKMYSVLEHAEGSDIDKGFAIAEIMKDVPSNGFAYKYGMQAMEHAGLDQETIKDIMSKVAKGKTSGGSSPSQPSSPVVTKNIKTPLTKEPTKHEVSAVKSYTGSSYKPMNEALRHSFGRSFGNYNADIQNLKHFLKSNPLQKEMTVHRKVGSSFADYLMEEHDKVGEKFIDFGFISTSTNPNAWSGSVHLEIALPKGAHAVDVKPWSSHPKEDEVLIQAGSKFEVIEVVGHNHFKMKLVRSGNGKDAVTHDAKRPGRSVLIHHHWDDKPDDEDKFTWNMDNIVLEKEGQSEEEAIAEAKRKRDQK